MATPTIRQADNGYWYIHWTDGRRSRRQSTGTKDVAKAKAALGHFLLIEQRSPTAPEQVFTAADLWKVYRKKHGVKVASPSSLDSSWKNLSIHFGEMTLAQIDQDAVEEYERKRAAGLIGRKAQASSVGLELRHLRACFGWCADKRQKIITKAQIPDFDIPAGNEPRDRWLREEEIKRLMQAAAEQRGRQNRLTRVERFLWLALETAGRKTALYELTWDRVDFETGVIHLNVPGRKQTKKRRADVPISKNLRPILVRAHDERINDYVLDHPGDLYTSVQSLVVKAGLAKQDLRSGKKQRKTGVSPHTLRHTAATHMARRGVPLWIIAKILGNSLQMTEKVYAKHCPDDLRKAVDMISGGVLETAE